MPRSRQHPDESLRKQVDAPPDVAGQLDALLAQVPASRVTTYGDLARSLGDVAASRWVGHHLLHHVHRAGCHCHRVVRAGGALGGYVTREVEDKRHLLRRDGVEIDRDRVDLERFGFTPRAADAPLERLAELQNRMAASVELHHHGAAEATIGGVDVSYPSASEGIAAYVLLAAGRSDPLWSTTVRLKVPFPYISSYLVFRELPLLAAVLDRARESRRLADIIMVDGSGIMHPRRAGLAACLGVIAAVPTIGVTKTLLAGRVEGRPDAALTPVPVVQDGACVGFAIRPRATSNKLIYVSPGHWTTPQACAQVTLGQLRGRPLPEPIYWADRISRSAVRAASADPIILDRGRADG